MMGQCRLEADITRSVNSLCQFKRVDMKSCVLIRQAVQAAMDAPDFAGAYGSLEQGIKTCVITVHPAGGLLSSEYPAHRLLDGHLCDGLHLLYTVIK